MYRAITTCLALPVFLICTAASAETISGALQNFGLAGIWSMDCSRDLRTQAGYRTTYSMPAAGPVTFTTIFRQPDGRTILMKSDSVDGRNIYAQDGRFSNGTETPFLERCFE